MKKITIILMAALLVCGIAGACMPGKSGGETALDITTPSDSTVEIIYFHGKQRCATCVAIERETKALVEEELASQVKDGKVSFRIVDISTDQGRRLASQFKVSFSSLFLVTSEGAQDLTRFAFANARNHAQEFRKELKAMVMESLE